MKRKMSWRSLKFIPVGGDESQSITRKDKGFMHLCELYRYHPERFPDYAIHDTRGMFARYGYNNVEVSWSDFRLALAKYSMKAPPEKPSVFCGEYFPPDHSIRMRKRLLAATLREYITAQSLAEDVLDWLSKGREEDVRRFLLTLLHGVGWLEKAPNVPEEVMTQQIRRPDGEVLMLR